jgi:hypothetical protein
MAEKVIVLKAGGENEGLTNIPANLKGLRFGDELVIKHLPACRTYPDFAKYMLGSIVVVDEVVQFFLAQNNGVFCQIEPYAFDDPESAPAKKRMRDLGYAGDFTDISIPIYADML